MPNSTRPPLLVFPFRHTNERDDRIPFVFWRPTPVEVRALAIEGGVPLRRPTPRKTDAYLRALAETPNVRTVTHSTARVVMAGERAHHYFHRQARRQHTPHHAFLLAPDGLAPLQAATGDPLETDAETTLQLETVLTPRGISFTLPQADNALHTRLIRYEHAMAALTPTSILKARNPRAFWRSVKDRVLPNPRPKAA